MADRKHAGGLEGGKGVTRETPTEMRRHAFCGARPTGAPGGLAVRCGGGRWGAMESRRCVLRPWGSQVCKGTPGHPGDRESLILKRTAECCS